MTTDIQTAKNMLLDVNLPMKQRMRALFYLRNIDSVESINAIISAFQDTSVLLKHEAAYVLGQIKNQQSKKYLIEVLSNENEDEIVRHEAAEALGNFLECSEIEIDEIKKVLNKFLQHRLKPISETCYLALMKFKEYEILKSKNQNVDFQPSPFQSFDPAFPLSNCTFEQAGDIYLNHKCLYQRYKAMFYLRNLNTKEAVEILSKGFVDKSALFKHEIAFVFGQMRNINSIDSLHQVLQNTKEHGMVRHEAAEALGAIGSDRSIPVLQPFLNDPVDVVKESVEVALDIHEYENSLQAEYAAI